MNAIVNKISVISVHYSDLESFSATTYLLKRTKDKVYIIQSLSGFGFPSRGNYITLVIISGYGVVSKTSDGSAEDLISKISNDGETFTFCYSEKNNEKKINFIRNSQLKAPNDRLEELKMPVCGFNLLAQKEMPKEEDITHLAGEFVVESLTLKNIVKPGIRNSSIAFWVYKKTRLKILCCILMLLIISIFITNSVKEKSVALTSRIEEVQKKIGKDNSSVQQKEVLFREFEQNIAWKYCWLCDRIAGDVSDKIKLSSLTIQKLQKKLDNNKSPELLNNTILVSGSSTYSEDVSDFMSALKKEPFVRELTLLSAKKSKESDALNFTIEILI